MYTLGMDWLYVAGPIVVVLILISIRVVKEYDRGVIFFLGKVTGVRGPGLIILIPIFEQMTRVTLRPEVPFQVNGVAVDLLSPQAGEDFLEATLAAPPGTMMEAPPLVYMKLKSPRRKDQVDVIEMIKGGIDTRRCREYLAAHAPALVAAFDESVVQAEDEED